MSKVHSWLSSFLLHASLLFLFAPFHLLRPFLLFASSQLHLTFVAWAKRLLVRVLPLRPMARTSTLVLFILAAPACACRERAATPSPLLLLLLLPPHSPISIQTTANHTTSTTIIVTIIKSNACFPDTNLCVFSCPPTHNRMWCLSLSLSLCLSHTHTHTINPALLLSDTSPLSHSPSPLSHTK